MLMLLHLIDNNRCKEILLSHFFKGMPYERFKALGQQFADHFISPTPSSPLGGMKRGDFSFQFSIFNKEVLSTLRQHLADGHQVYIISASVEEWVRPIAQRLGVTNVLCTRLAVGADGRLTGKYDGNNCHGQEKVNRFLAVEPHRDEYYLYAYGDSSGDKQLFALADEYQKIKH